MSTAGSTNYSLSGASSNVEGGGGGTPRSGSKPPRSTPGSTENSPAMTASKVKGGTGIRSSRRTSPSGKESEGNSAEETSPKGSVEIKRPTKPRPTTSVTGEGVMSVRGISGFRFNNVGNLGLLTRARLITEILKRQQPPAPSSSNRAREIKSQLRTYTKFQLIAELTRLLSPEERNALNARKQKAIEQKNLEAAASAALKKRKAQKAAALSAWGAKRKAASAKVKREEVVNVVKRREVGIQTNNPNSNAVVETPYEMKGPNQTPSQEMFKTFLLATEFAKKMEVMRAAGYAKAAKELGVTKKEVKELYEKIDALKRGQITKPVSNNNNNNTHTSANVTKALVKNNPQFRNEQIKRLYDKFALVEIKQNKKLGEIATNISKSTRGLSKKNILDFISKSAKSNNKLTKKDILEFLSKQKTPTVTVKQSIGNVKAEGGKANVQIVNSKKLNREARLDQNIKRRDANYRRIVTADPMALKRQKRVFAKKRGELLKSIQKIIKSDRKTSPKIKKKVYDSYVKSPRDRISKLLKLPKKELITMIKRSTSRISK